VRFSKESVSLTTSILWTFQDVRWDFVIMEIILRVTDMAQNISFFNWVTLHVSGQSTSILKSFFTIFTLYFWHYLLKILLYNYYTNEIYNSHFKIIKQLIRYRNTEHKFW
jgi:hypothetical protein